MQEPLSSISRDPFLIVAFGDYRALEKRVSTVFKNRDRKALSSNIGLAHVVGNFSAVFNILLACLVPMPLKYLLSEIILA